MQRARAFLLQLVFFLQVLLLFLLLVQDRVALPVWLQVAGRLHPVILHVPIGLLVFLAALMFLRKQFEEDAFNKTVFILLLLTSFSATLTALFGFFLSRQGDYGADGLAQHKAGGVVLSILCYLLVLVFDRFKSNAWFVGLSVITVATVLFTGHSGGTLTHGENFVMAPLLNSKREVAIDTNASFFQSAIYPVLEKKCVTCHNPSKAKGKWVMTSVEELTKGGENGKEWMDGNPSESRMIKYIHLPLADDKHMPPDGKPQLTSQEMKLLALWIKSGAALTKKLTEIKDHDSLRILSVAMASANKRTEEKHYPFPAASAETVKKLNTPFRSVFPLYQNSAALQADFFVKKSFQTKSLEELNEVKEQLVALNLSKMPVTDQDLAVIGNFKNLEKLNLNFSQVSGQGLSSLRGLAQLNSISLAGTQVNMESLKPILTLPSLKEIFIWSTRVSEAEYVALARQYPKVLVVGSEFNDERVLRLSKPVLVNEGVIKKGEPVILKHSMPGVIIKYTLDGLLPDSVTSPTYNSPLDIKATTKIKAIVCKPGWYCSEVFERTCFVEGMKPVSAELLAQPDKKYPGEGNKSLTDGRKGFIEVFKEPGWLGYRDHPFAAGFDFGKNPVPIKSIVLSYGKDLGGYVFPPEKVEVWAGPNKADLKLLKIIDLKLPAGFNPNQIEALSIPMEGKPYSFFKLIAKPVGKIPHWHFGKGDRGWVMVDEVFFY
jgi:uncharacterized membrane protein